ncbi:hypothetical protein V5F63_05325 [Xanthobacter autotrophicus DSM 597]|uniref:hypothetical protein n=1 Tax=Xanthobacter wiegelii TaxID=3119913 RepID=UPI003728C5D0
MDRLFKILDLPATIIGFATVVYIALLYLAPGVVAAGLARWAAYTQQAVYAYYEVGTDDSVTNQDGRLYLTRTGPRGYVDLHPGDRLLAADQVNLRLEPTASSAVFRLLNGGECVMVIGEPVNSVPVTNAKSGGYLKVAPVRCN